VQPNGANNIMANPDVSVSSTKWSPATFYGMAAVCLVIGLALGYLLRGSQAGQALPTPAAPVASLPAADTPAPRAQSTSMAEMKRMADAKAAPFIAQLQSDPKNVKVLTQVAALYSNTHQFGEAVSYYQRALKVDPKNVPARTEMASCLYYTGDVEGALSQLQESLSYDPKNANALFNLGMIKWRGKNDAAGAIVAWQTLLKTNPKLDRKPIVEKMIAEAKVGNAAPSER
jgi:cytochrome c-type biogenesis protein CcmH/NrfG